MRPVGKPNIVRVQVWSLKARICHLLVSALQQPLDELWHPNRGVWKRAETYLWDNLLQQPNLRVTRHFMVILYIACINFMHGAICPEVVQEMFLRCANNGSNGHIAAAVGANSLR